MMELYKREKANPVSGCLPILLTIPVFFSLYKVLYVTIEMRHAPFYGWIHDLSAPDPTSILNLFGLLPFNPHAALPGFLAYPFHRRLADPVRHHPVGADQAEPAAARSGAGQDVRLHAADLHLHVRHLPGGPGDLLRLEQSSDGDPAVLHHEARRRGDAPCSTISRPKKPPKRRMTELTTSRSRAQAVRRALRFRLGRDLAAEPAARKPERGRLCRPLQCRQVQPGQCADGAQKPGAGLPDAGRAPGRSTSSTWAAG